MRMTHAYPQCYVSDAANSLSAALDYAVHDCGIGIDDFGYLFVASGISEMFEHGNPAVVAGMSGVELARAVLSFTYGESEWPLRKLACGLSAEYWAGWALAQYQWYAGKRFRDIFSTVPLSEVAASLYPVHHEAPIERFLETMDALIAERMEQTRLKVIRSNAGLTQQQLADRSGVNVRNIQMYEQRNNDINQASVLALYRIARVLGCSIEDLLEL